MDLANTTLANFFLGCDRIDRGAFGRFVTKWQSEAKDGLTLGEYLFLAEATSCTEDELALLGDANACVVTEETANIEGVSLDYARFRNDWYAPNGGRAANGISNVREIVLPSFAFTADLFRDQQANTMTVASADATVIDNSNTDSNPSVLPTTESKAAVAVQRSPKSVPFPVVGDTLGRCLLEKELGRGASSVVYQAKHAKLGIRVAVKVLVVGAVQQDAASLEMIRHEARLLAQINHPNIVRVFDVEDEGAWPYLVLEFVEGTNLAAAIVRGTLDIPEVVRIAIRVCEGLAAAYSLGVIHRDIKPENVALTDDGQVKVVDFGVGLTADSHRHTADSPLVGTAQYISPEQAKCEAKLDHRSDMYSLGATIYHALTGASPFGNGDFTALLLKHMSAVPVAPQQLKPEIPEPLNAIVMRLLSKTPQERYATYDLLIADLRKCLGSPTAPAKKTSLVSWLKRRGKPSDRG